MTLTTKSIPLPNLAYTRTYRLSTDHVHKLRELSAKLRKDNSEIVREAIDEYYQRHQEELETPAEA